MRGRAAGCVVAVATGGAALVGLPVAASAASLPACGAGAQNGLSISANHADTFYTDLGDGLNAAYLGYQVTNSGVPRTDLWARVSNFAGGSVTLADASDDRAQIASLGSSAAATRFFLVKAANTTTTAQSHAVTVYDRRPDLEGATALASCSFTFTQVKSTISANANQVTAIAASPAQPTVGGMVTVTVDGKTGQADGAVWVSPAASALWPSKALRLESTTLEVNTDGRGAAEQSFQDSLFIPAAVAAGYTSSTTYRATYRFRLTRPTATDPVVKPVAQISSGGQFKHTGSYPTLPSLATSAAGAAVTVGKAVTAVDLAALATTTSPNGVAGSTRYVEVPYRVYANASAPALLDEFVDVPAPGVIFKRGSAALTDAAAAGALPDPVGSTADHPVRSGALHFTGPFVAAAGTPAALTYTMYVPLTPGTYRNQAYATLGGTTIGADPSSIPSITVTTDGSAVTAVTSATTGAGTEPQRITVAAPTTVPVVGAATVTATSDAGLPVTLTSDTPATCTLVGYVVNPVAVGDCVLSATQPGNATYVAADPVSVSLTVVRGSQTISFAQPADTTPDAGSVTVTVSATSALPVGLTSETPQICDVTGATVSIVGVGACVLTASQDGDSSWAPAEPVQRSFLVAEHPRLPQRIDFVEPTDMTMAGPSGPLSATADSGLPVTVRSLTPDVCAVSDGAVVPVSVGTCSLEASQPGDDSYAGAQPVERSFAITKAAQEIAFAGPADVSLTATKVALHATSTSGLPVSFASLTTDTCATEGAAALLLASGICTIEATQSGDTRYASAPPVRGSFTVGAVVPPPSGGTRTSTGTAGATQQVIVDLTPGATITLLGHDGLPTTTVVVDGGTYVLDNALGVIIFVPRPGFSGTAPAVTFRVTDGYDRTADGTYAATVAGVALPPQEPAAPTTPAPADRLSLVVPVKKASVGLSVTSRRGVLPVVCTTPSTRLRSCSIVLRARISGADVVVGRATARPGAPAHRLVARVPLTPLGVALSRRVGGFRVAVDAIARDDRSGAALVRARAARVVAPLVIVARPVLFGTDSARIRPGDGAYLRELRRRLGGVDEVTCVGFTDARGSLASGDILGHRRAAAVCSALRPLVGVRFHLESLGEQFPRATNGTAEGRALNRRTEIRLRY